MRLNKLLMMCSLSFVFSFVSCNSGNNVTIINEDETKGTVVTQSGYYKPESLLYLEAIPNENYLFTGWYCDGIALSYKEICSFIVPKDRAITITAKWENWSTQTFEFELVEALDHSQSFEICKYYGWKDDDEIIVPATHYGFPVTKIRNEVFKEKNNIKSINVPESILEIGSNTFSNCSADKVYLPGTIIKMGDTAFLGFDDTKEIHISPHSVKVDSEENYKTQWGWDLNPVYKKENTYIDLTPSSDPRKSGSYNTYIIADNN